MSNSNSMKWITVHMQHTLIHEPFCSARECLFANGYIINRDNCLFHISHELPDRFFFCIHIWFCESMFDVNMYRRARSDSDHLRWKNLIRHTYMHECIQTHLTAKTKQRREQWNSKRNKEQCVSNSKSKSNSKFRQSADFSAILQCERVPFCLNFRWAIISGYLAVVFIPHFMRSKECIGIIVGGRLPTDSNNNAILNVKTCLMIDFNCIGFNFSIVVILFISFWTNSPVFPTRTTYTPSSSNLHYFTNTSPTPEAQMWSTASANNDDYDRPKNGALPDFQRLTNSYYATNGRAAHISYPSQVVSD